MATEIETEREALVAVIRTAFKGRGWLPNELPGDTADALLAAGWTSGRARLDLRDWFAGQALSGLLSGHPDADCGPKGYAQDAFVIADAMLAARVRK